METNKTYAVVVSKARHANVGFPCGFSGKGQQGERQIDW